METNPRDYGKQCRFDAFYKTVLGLASTLDFFAQGATVQALFVLVYSHITSMLFYISGTDIRTKHQFIF